MNTVEQPLIVADNLVKHFPVAGSRLRRERHVVHALDGVSLNINAGEVLGLVGESGCGKTTLGRCILRLIELTDGRVLFDERDLAQVKGTALRSLRAEMQIVFQNPYSSLNPRMRVEAILQEPLRTHRVPYGEWRKRILTLLEQVGLGAQHLDRYPHELSGGQCQRVAIARALSLHPRLIVLDEPTSALDVSVQAQIINLLGDLREQSKLTYLFISHDLGVVEHLSDRIGVMYLGKLVEIGRTEEVFGSSKHPYTRALLASIPGGRLRQETPPLEGTIPSPINPPTGCRFHTRCPLAQQMCRDQEPLLKSYGSTHWAACHFAE